MNEAKALLEAAGFKIQYSRATLKGGPAGWFWSKANGENLTVGGIFATEEAACQHCQEHNGHRVH